MSQTLQPRDGKTPVAVTDDRDIVMVAGQDPYPYRGTLRIAQPEVRPSGEGGCVDWSEDDH